MIKSMTGFGRSQINENGYSIICEIKGVNHRYFDPHIRISRRYLCLEDKVKEELKQKINRGKLEISISIEKTEEYERNIEVDKGLAMAYYKSLKELAEFLHISADIRLIDLFRLPDVYSLQDVEEDLELTWKVLEKCLREALGKLVDMRIKEGYNLMQDMLTRNDLILERVEQLERRSPLVAQENQDKLRSRITELINQPVVDETRILQEAAIFADRASVTEEIIRLKSHIKQFNDILNHGDEAVGRKCDFLVQEMFREINTVASKANDLEMSQIVVEVKAELEKIREQLQNIE